MKISSIVMVAVAVFIPPAVDASRADELKRLSAIPFQQVRFDDGLWKSRIDANRARTIMYDFRKCETTGRISNFDKAAGKTAGKFEGYFFNDSDVYKVIEGAAYSLATHPDPKLEKYLDDLIARIAAAQQKDGYLNSYYTLVEPAKRWTNEPVMHELYCAGHLFEAAVAHFQTTKKRTLLDVAIKFADHIDQRFGPGKTIVVPGHQEIEIGLVKLYQTTGEKRYLKLAEFFLDERGKAHGRRLSGAGIQDHKPVLEQTEAVGHAVRAAYMYTGMADVAATTGRKEFIDALDKLWDNVVNRKLYVTGAIGASPGGEAFGREYELPNSRAYGETCAAIANVFWNHRLNLLHADAKYVDVLELSLYNAVLPGVSLSGEEFHYPNPLEADGKRPFNHGSAGRQPWFDCACCPVNVVRVFPSLGQYMYATGDDSIYVNLFGANSASVALGERTVKLTQKTEYPWQGKVKLSIAPDKPATFDVRVRIPTWAVGPGPVRGDLYRYADVNLRSAAATNRGSFSLKVNGQLLDKPNVLHGYAVVRREWKAGDVIELDLPMPIRRVVAHEKVKANVGRVALMRGPIVYCLEQADNSGGVLNLSLPRESKLSAAHKADLLGGVTIITGSGLAAQREKDQQETKTKEMKITAIPYCVWNHRSRGEMTVWIPEEPDLGKSKLPATIGSTSRASASHTWTNDTTAALNDQQEPSSSGDQEIPRFTWWDKRGTKEWVQYDFAKPSRVSAVEVYWFDDTGAGQCRVPKSWRLLRQDGKDWKPVAGASKYGVEKDRYNLATFAPVETTALRLEVQLQTGVSGGILEWKVK